MPTTRKFLQSASQVSIGTLVGQLIAFAGSLILVRIFSPEEMGVFATVVAVSSFVAPLVSGQLANAIPLPARNNSAMTLVKIACISALTFGILIGIVLLLVQFYIPSLKTLGLIWVWGLPALILSLTLYVCSNQLAVRFEKYLGLAVRGIMYPSIMTGAQICLGFFHFGSQGLVLGMFLGHIVTALTLWLPIQRSIRFEETSDCTWKHLIIEYRNFPMILGPAGAINSLAMQMPQLGITLIFGFAVGGQFGMMMKILAVPIMLIGQSIGFVYAGEVAKSRRQGIGNVINLYNRLSVVLLFISLVFVLGVYFLGENIFTRVLGKTWSLSGEFAALFVLATGAQLIASPLSQTLVISERTFQQFGIDVFRVVALAGAFLAIYIFEIALRPAVVIIGIVSMLGYWVLWYVNRRAAMNINPVLPQEYLSQ